MSSETKVEMTWQEKQQAVIAKIGVVRCMKLMNGKFAIQDLSCNDQYSSPCASGEAAWCDAYAKEFPQQEPSPHLNAEQAHLVAKALLKFAALEAAPQNPPGYFPDAIWARSEAAPSLPQQVLHSSDWRTVVDLCGHLSYADGYMQDTSRTKGFKETIKRGQELAARLSVAVPKAPSAQMDEPRCILCNQDRGHHFAGRWCAGRGLESRQFTPSSATQPASQLSDEQRVKRAVSDARFSYTPDWRYGIFSDDIQLSAGDGWLCLGKQNGTNKRRREKTWAKALQHPSVVAYEQSLAEGKETK